MSMDLFERFASGRLVLEAGECNAADCPWKAHPAFSGGMLKDLLSTEQTGGLYSLHLVRIEPGMSIGLHTHPESVELHAVLDGSGWLRMGGGKSGRMNRVRCRGFPPGWNTRFWRMRKACV